MDDWMSLDSFWREGKDSLCAESADVRSHALVIARVETSTVSMANFCRNDPVPRYYCTWLHKINFPTYCTINYKKVYNEIFQIYSIHMYVHVYMCRQTFSL